LGLPGGHCWARSRVQGAQRRAATKVMGQTVAAQREVYGPAVPAPTLRRRSAVGERPPRLPRPRLLSCGPSLTSSPDGFPAGHSNGKAGARRTGAKRRAGEFLFHALERIRPYPYFRTNSHLTNTRIGHPAEVFLLSNTYARRPKDKAVSSR
jgi:hypothetical protein